MFDQAPPLPTGAELDILGVIWRIQPCTEREMHEALQTGTGYTSTLKLMQLMTAKGLLRRNERFRQHLYEAAAPHQETQRQIAGDLIRRTFGGSSKDLVLGALSAQPASREEMDEIRKVLDAATKKRGAK